MYFDEALLELFQDGVKDGLHVLPETAELGTDGTGCKEVSAMRAPVDPSLASVAQPRLGDDPIDRNIQCGKDRPYFLGVTRTSRLPPPFAVLAKACQTPVK